MAAQLLDDANASGYVHVDRARLRFRVDRRSYSDDESFRIVEKRACLDLDPLMPQGALAFIL